MTASTSPSWYDVLGVDPDASPADIRTAWRDGIADLDPGDRRFRLLSDAAEVLLDPQRRSAYDDELTPTPTPEEPEAVRLEREHSGIEKSPTRHLWPGGAGSGSLRRRGRGSEAEEIAASRGEALRGRAQSDVSAHVAPGPNEVIEKTPQRGGKREPKAPTASTQTVPEDTEATPVPRTGPSTWVLAPLAVLTALALALAAYLLTQPADSQVASNTQDAQSAAERAVPVILAYDYRRMDADEKASDALMTPDYAAKYNALFAQLKANSDSTQTVVTADPPLDSGVVRSGDDRVQILVFVNRSRTNAASSTPLIFHDQVRVTMVKSGNDWLVDDLQTSPIAS